MRENTIKSKTFFLEPVKEPWREGYLIPVRNRLNNILEHEFLPEDLKEKYLSTWGQTIIFIDQFHDWYYEERKRQS